MAFFVIISLLLFIQVQLGYRHSHYLEDGSKIEHAHPYQGATDSGHQHSKDQILILAQLSNLNIEKSSSLQLQENTLYYSERISSVECNPTFKLQISLEKLRGPPRFLFVF